MYSVVFGNVPNHPIQVYKDELFGLLRIVSLSRCDSYVLPTVHYEYNYFECPFRFFNSTLSGTTDLAFVSKATLVRSQSLVRTYVPSFRIFAQHVKGTVSQFPSTLCTKLLE